jgi:hypothetical protein
MAEGVVVVAGPDEVEVSICEAYCCFCLFVFYSFSDLASMSGKQQRLVLAIIDFLNQSINDGTVKSDDKESLEVAGKQHRIQLSLNLILLFQSNASAKPLTSIHQTRSRLNSSA